MKEKFRNRGDLKSRSIQALEELLQDFRFAARQLRTNRGFSLTAIAVLTLGIGASSAIFAFVDAALVKPLPYRDPSQLLALYERNPAGDRFHLSDHDYRIWKQRNSVSSSLDIYHPDRYALSRASGPEEVYGAVVSDGFFRTLGVSPSLGRDFQPGEDMRSAPRTVMLSFESWQKRFGSDAKALGQSVTLDGDSYLIIGVLPSGFHFAPVGKAEFWTTLHGRCEGVLSCFPFYGVARLRPGISAASAYDNFSLIAQQIATEFPQHNRDRSAIVIPLTDAILGDTRPFLVALLIGAGLLSLIGFINVSSLFLVRAEHRRREIAVRGALGASRLRLLMQFVVEGFLLAAIGGTLASALAFCAIRPLIHLIPPNLLQNMPYLEGIHFNAHVVFSVMAVSILGGILFSVVPALHLIISDMRAGLTEGGRTSVSRGWRRLGAGLVVVELAITVVLLVGAGLLAKSFYRLLHVDVGISIDHLAMAHVSRPGGWDDRQRNIALQRQLLSRIAALPGVTSAGLSAQPPVGSGEGFTLSFTHYRVAGKPNIGQGNETIDQVVSAGYFETVRAHLIQGRYFTDADDASVPMEAIVNRTMAIENFPGETALGKHIVWEWDPGHPIEIIGVIDDIKDGPLDMKPVSAVYRPFNQGPSYDYYVILRTSQSETAMLPTMVKAIHSIDPTLIVDDEETMTDRMNNSQSAYLHRSAARMVAGFAAFALLLGSVGLYGVISYSVGKRRREIGVRMALGAQRSSVYHLILSEAAWLLTLGVAAGILSSIWLTAFLQSILFRVSPWDPVTMLCVICVVIPSALLASYIPARRAAAINPTEALRAE